jgi:peptidoglycan hydrolase-like protein with peptidoglycan-binding domain
MKFIPTVSSILLLFSLVLAVPPVSAQPSIYHAQVALQQLGYQPGPADGAYGPKTRKAIKRFQRDHGLAITGDLTPATVARIKKSLRRQHR